MVNLLWLALIIVGITTAMINGKMDEVSQSIFAGAVDTVEILIKLIGPMALWLGLMNIARESGLTDLLAKIIKPLLNFIFPEIPDNHPASGSILLNLTANMLGLGNSATPLGIKAMQDLQDLNNKKNSASISMCTLLALNTSSVTLVPATIISLRAAAGSSKPALILITTFFATSASTVTALILDKIFRYFTGESL